MRRNTSLLLALTALFCFVFASSALAEDIELVVTKMTDPLKNPVVIPLEKFDRYIVHEETHELNKFEYYFRLNEGVFPKDGKIQIAVPVNRWLEIELETQIGYGKENIDFQIEISRVGYHDLHYRFNQDPEAKKTRIVPLNIVWKNSWLSSQPENTQKMYDKIRSAFLEHNDRDKFPATFIFTVASLYLKGEYSHDEPPYKVTKLIVEFHITDVQVIY